jgi:hypothetical protein
MTSLDPPAENPTTMVMGFKGYSSACALMPSDTHVLKSALTKRVLKGCIV